MKKIFLFVLLFLSIQLTAQIETQIEVEVYEGSLTGLLTEPEGQAKNDLAIIVAGSGPTDMNGNSVFINCDNLKLLSDSLVEAGISTLRYNKRGSSNTSNLLPESSLRIETYVNDLLAVIKSAQSSFHFERVFLFGHSEGSLMCLLALSSLEDEIDGFVSLSGVASKADKIIMDQLKGLEPDDKKEAQRIINGLLDGETVDVQSANLKSLFRKSVQPYMISWFKVSPLELYKSLNISKTAVGGSADLQVPIEELHALCDNSDDCMVIQDMNHLLKMTPNEEDNYASYSDPNFPISSELVRHCVAFVKNN